MKALIYFMQADAAMVSSIVLNIESENVIHDALLKHRDDEFVTFDRAGGKTILRRSNIASIDVKETKYANEPT